MKINIFKCDICGKEFPQERQIKGWVRINFGEDDTPSLEKMPDICYTEICSPCAHNIDGYINSLKPDDYDKS